MSDVMLDYKVENRRGTLYHQALTGAWRVSSAAWLARSGNLFRNHPICS